ncbi:uncharacterized protein ARMOST_10772 [Armillaria ostoyae]|uniref:Uncharacterized protein n=1 Tax=Armillaria ostoyae TaxID=47428 RepID=A0A284RF93_ARMOS|nr:uncharacterized protein ARMOST_10772 [Armillaria ostoyae]
MLSLQSTKSFKEPVTSRPRPNRSNIGPKMVMRATGTNICKDYKASTTTLPQLALLRPPALCLSLHLHCSPHCSSFLLSIAQLYLSVKDFTPVPSILYPYSIA